jgi:hypothetical protein
VAFTVLMRPFASSSRSMLRPTKISFFAPRSAKDWAMARPIPRDAPVMTAVLPARVRTLDMLCSRAAHGSRNELNYIHRWYRCRAALAVRDGPWASPSRAALADLGLSKLLTPR